MVMTNPINYARIRMATFHTCLAIGLASLFIFFYLFVIVWDLGLIIVSTLSYETYYVITKMMLKRNKSMKQNEIYVYHKEVL